MSDDLNELMQRFPPPDKPRYTPINWENLEAALGLCYPPRFRDFIDVYGGCVWFDNLSPLYSQAQTAEEAKGFLQTVERKCNQDRGNTYDEDGKPFSPAFYPEERGLFPFLVDYAGNMYYWDRKPENSDEWSIVQSHGGWMTPFPAMSIPTMILKWLDRDPEMIKMWGDVEQVPAERLRITET